LGVLAHTGLWDTKSKSRVAGSLLNVVFPNYLSLVGFGWSEHASATPGINRVRSTSPIWGWRPLLVRTWEPVYLTTLTEVSWYREATQTSLGDRRPQMTFGGSVGTTVWTIPIPKVSLTSLEIGGVYTRHVLHQESTPVPRPFWAWNVTGRLLSEKIYVNLRGAPNRALATSVGFSDLNGLLYWWLR
jgi:hypothetical protein